jgi:hypothetical protein
LGGRLLYALPKVFGAGALLWVFGALLVYAIPKGRVPEGGLPSREDCFVLLDRAFTIFNHYASLFHSTTTSTKIIGEESHDFVFELLRIGLKAYRDRRLQQFERDLEHLPSA